ncbi:MAG: N-acetyl-gamma-glutamyl-phosphate reductase [Nitrosopumilaceae archaeon]
MKVGVVGASGYVGGETLRLLVNHPDVEIAMVTSRQHVGEYLHRVQPSLKGFTDLTFSELDYDKISDKCDVVFTAVPHGTATEIVKALYDRGIKIIDLKAQLVSCPGCMAVTSMLALAPLIRNDLIDIDHIVVDSKIGSSGAGSGSGTAHAMRAGVIRPYKPAKHRHTGEIEQELSEIAGRKIHVSMSPHAVDVVRGILCTNHTFMKKDIEEKELWKLYRQAYGEEKFVRLIRDKKGLYKFPDPKFLVGSNFCDIGFDLDEDNHRLIALSASDNLMKGAAGSAVQNMNVMCGFDEMDGLRYTPLTPV